MESDVDFATVVPDESPTATAEIEALLAARGLETDRSVQVFVTGRLHGRLVACAGLDGPIVKCVAVCSDVEHHDLLTRVMAEVAYEAVDRGVPHLFLYTSPAHVPQFEACGFHTVVEVPEQITMMENTPIGIHAYAEELALHRRDRDTIGACVVNANPMTLGHRYLLQQAARACDLLHVFVVSEDASFFPFDERLALVRAGVAELPERDRIIVHPGTRYIVSKATFPTYFLKDSGLVDLCATAVDLLVFREHIAPALGITQRYVGNEPFCAVTRRYNSDMHYWLERTDLATPPVHVHEIDRMEIDGRAVSATDVRRRLLAGDVDSLRGLVPAPTFRLLDERYRHRPEEASHLADRLARCRLSPPHPPRPPHLAGRALAAAR